MKVEDLKQLQRLYEQIPVDYAGGSSIEKGIKIFSLIKEFDFKFTVDIGVHYGRTFFPQALAHKLYTNGRAIGIDPYSKEASYQKDMPENQKERDEWLEKCDFEKVWNFVNDFTLLHGFNDSDVFRMTSHQFILNKGIQIKMIGFIHIDGNHDIKNAIQDVEDYFPFVKDGGIIMLDDTNFISVQPADKLLKEKCTFIKQIVDDTSIYSVFIKNPTPEQLEKATNILNEKVLTPKGKLLSIYWKTEPIIAMGDVINIVALANEISKKERIMLPIKTVHLDNMKSFFPEDANIDFIQLENYNHLHDLEKYYECINIHADNMYYKGAQVNPLIESIWVISGYDYEKREELCPIKHQIARIPQIEPPTTPYAFVSDIGSNKKYSIEDKFIGEGLTIIRPPKDALMLSYAKIIENATEIHCIASAWFQLIEKIPTTGELIYHQYRRGHNLKREQWNILKNWNILGDNPYVIKGTEVLADRNPVNDNYKLSILICSLPERMYELYKLVTYLEEQNLSKDVQIIYVGDNRTMTTGEKRNWLKRCASGKFISFVDDDDFPSIDYVKTGLKAIKENPSADVICFEVEYDNRKSGAHKSVCFSKDYTDNAVNDDADILYRQPNHLMFVKRSIAPDFPDMSHVEDNYYGDKLKPLIKNEVIIPKVLYYYDYNPYVSEGQNMPNTMDVVIVSDGTGLRKMTNDAITTLDGKATPIIVEKNRNIEYDKAITIYQNGKEFNYNRYLNEGAKLGKEEYICFSNNDVIFSKHFVQKAIWEMNARKIDIGGVKDHNKYYPDPNDSITGWCFIMRRKVWEDIGGLNENYKFWASDWIVTKQIKNYKYRVLKDVFVVHFASKSLNLLPEEKKLEYKDECVKQYNKDNSENRFGMGY